MEWWNLKDAGYMIYDAGDKHSTFNTEHSMFKEMLLDVVFSKLNVEF